MNEYLESAVYGAVMSNKTPIKMPAVRFGTAYYGNKFLIIAEGILTLFRLRNTDAPLWTIDELMKKSDCGNCTVYIDV